MKSEAGSSRGVGVGPSALRGSAAKGEQRPSLGAESCPKATGGRPCTKATDTEPRNKVSSGPNRSPLLTKAPLPPPIITVGFLTPN